MLTPLNYFDSDPSMESLNAILLSVPTSPNEPFGFNDYGVKQDYTCIPETPVPFNYGFAETYDADGKREVLSVEDMRKNMELHHRIKVEL